MPHTFVSLLSSQFLCVSNCIICRAHLLFLNFFSCNSSYKLYCLCLYIRTHSLPFGLVQTGHYDSSLLIKCTIIAFHLLWLEMNISVQLLSIIFWEFATLCVEVRKKYSHNEVDALEVVMWRHVSKMASLYVPSYVVPSELKASAPSNATIVLCKHCCAEGRMFVINIRINAAFIMEVCNRLR